ncbi:HNH endonuclease [Sphingopyxis panaciterrae]
MAIDNVISYIEKTPIDLASSWDYDAVTAMSGQKIPDIFLGDQQPILRGDQYRLWLRWFLEGMISPLAVARNASLQRLHVLAAVFQRLDLLYHGVDETRRSKLADLLTEHIFAEVERYRSAATRDHAQTATRAALIAERSPPRCYICGYAFSAEARASFLRERGADPMRVPPLVDIFRPRLKLRDIRIEIEHVVPVQKGGHGQDNLKLACGWCNKHKSSRVSLYEAGHMAPHITGFRIGEHEIHELPNPFWMIRILALRGECRHAGGCDKSALQSEMYVSLVDWRGSPNPTNLTIFCREHDPIAADRFQAPGRVEALWKARR